ncbi:MAG: non-homologous end-joining DNA ligase [Nocardioidaceae bacterium]
MSTSEDRWIEPMAATLTNDRFSDPGWLFERKLDGVRTLATRYAGRTRLMSRNRKDVSSSYPEIVTALDETTDVADFVVDGEIVAFDGNRTSFAMLQKRIHQTDARTIAASGVPAYFYAFDLLRWDGHDARSLPLRERKSLLLDALDFTDPLRFTEHRLEHGEEAYEQACARGWEGVIAKRADGRYRSGRSRDWLKFKCVREQEFVVGGLTPPSGSRHGLGALLIGHHASDGLRYAGKVGTGFTEAMIAELRKRLDPLEQSASPFVDPPREKGARWVRPELVVQVAFSEWTTAGRLRHPSYKGIRTDKAAADVVREEADQS